MRSTFINELQGASGWYSDYSWPELSPHRLQTAKKSSLQWSDLTNLICNQLGIFCSTLPLLDCIPFLFFFVYPSKYLWPVDYKAFGFIFFAHLHSCTCHVSKPSFTWVGLCWSSPWGLFCLFICWRVCALGYFFPWHVPLSFVLPRNFPSVVAQTGLLLQTLWNTA